MPERAWLLSFVAGTLLDFEVQEVGTEVHGSMSPAVLASFP